MIGGIHLHDVRGRVLAVVLRHVAEEAEHFRGRIERGNSPIPESDLGSPLGIVGRNHAAYRAAQFLAGGGRLVAGSGNRPPGRHAGQD